MKVYLLNPPFIKGFSRGVRGSGEATRGGTLYYPIFLSYAAGVLEKNNHKIKLVDAQAKGWTFKDILNDISDFSPDILVVDTNFSSLNNDIKIASDLKKISGIKVVIVGPPISQYSKKLFANNNIDYAIKYEYDLTLTELIEAIEDNIPATMIKGIIFRDKNDIIETLNRDLLSAEELDTLPFVSLIYEKHLNIEDYFVSCSFYPMVQIFSGRGCPNKCVFCSWPKTFMGNKYRARSVNNLIEEFLSIENKLPKIKEIFLEDDTFTLSRRRISEFCKKYREEDLNIPWSCNSRANLDFETMNAMKKSNCRLLIVGYESGNNDILRNIKKNITVDQMKRFSIEAKKANLLVHGDFIIGLPGETLETIKKTEEFIYEVRPELLQVLLPQPIPGTDLYEWSKSNGFLSIDDPNKYLDEEGYQKSVITYPHLSSDKLFSECQRILKKYYLSPKYVPIAMRQVSRKNSVNETKRLLHSAVMFLKFMR